jgi:hypothetical protein
MGEREPIEWPRERLVARRRFLWAMAALAGLGGALGLVTRRWLGW